MRKYVSKHVAVLRLYIYLSYVVLTYNEFEDGIRINLAIKINQLIKRYPLRWKFNFLSRLRSLSNSYDYFLEPHT